jgi:hypothetical protein
MPDPIPVTVLARLATDSAYEKQGLGSRFSTTPCSAPSRPHKSLALARCRFMRCQATRSASYSRAGFRECPIDPIMMMMMMTLQGVRQSRSTPRELTIVVWERIFAVCVLDPYGLRQTSSYATCSSILPTGCRMSSG